MANIKISNLITSSVLDGTELIPIVQNGANKQATVGQIVTKVDSYTKTESDSALGTKVDKATGKALSTNDLTDTLLALLNLKKVKNVTTDAVNNYLVITYTDDTVSNLNLNSIVTDVNVTGASLDATSNVLTLTSDDGGADVTVDLSDFINSSELNNALVTKQDKLTEGAFVNGDKTKLDSIETGATADQTKAEIDAMGVNAGTVNGKTVETNVPVEAVFTDTQVTIEDVLTSTSSTNGLSANMGKQLQDTKVGSDITTISTGSIVTNMFKCTQAEYDGITPDANTFYIIVG